MRFVLCAINAKYIHSNLAVHSLKAYADSQGTGNGEILVKEYTINQYTDDILADLYEADPDVLIFSCYLWNINHVNVLAREFHKIRPSVPIWLGGPEVSYDADHVLKTHPEVDMVMRGEGEVTFSKLVEIYETSPSDPWGRLALLPGIAWRNKISGNNKREETEEAEIIDNGMALPVDLDHLPFVYRDMEPFRNKILYYESSRGCPYHCSYCLSSLDGSVRFRSLDLVRKDLDAFLQAGVPQVKFVDRTFNCRKEHAMAIWNYINEKDNGVTNFHFEIAGDLLDQEEIALFETMRPGLIQLEIGLQSTNKATLEEIRRVVDAGKVISNIIAVRQTGKVHQHLDLIAGLPFENYERFGRSFTEAFIFLPDQLQLGFLKVLKGTMMRDKAKDYGLVYRDRAPYEVLSTKWMTYGDLIRLKRIEAILETYYNSGQYPYTLKYAIPFYATPFDFFEQFADWYHEQGHDRRNHSRMEKCNLLHDFLMTHPELAPQKDVVEDILLYDWYCKEKSKVRPPWARDNSDYKKEWKLIFRKYGRRCHIERFGIDMQKLTAYGEVCHDISFCLFDYEDLHPLTGEAKGHFWREGDCT